MANSSAYKLLLSAQIDESTLTSQIKAINAKNTILLSVKFNTGDMAKLNEQLDKLKAAGNQLSKVTISSNASGNIGKAAIEYLDANKNIVKTTIQINENLRTTQTTTQNLTKDANEFAKSLLNAEKFLEKARNLQQTPTVKTAVGTAEQIKVAVSEGDIEKVRLLNKELELNKAALQTGRTGLDSWTEGMKNAIKQTVEYAVSIGLIYGALAQLKQGIGFVTELNKELVNIQVLQAEGAKSNEEIANLAGKYNLLAREVGATTIEVAKGSVEWLFI